MRIPISHCVLSVCLAFVLGCGPSGVKTLDQSAGNYGRPGQGVFRVGVALHGISEEAVERYMRSVKGMQQVFSFRYDVVLREGDPGEAEERAALKELLDSNVDALVVMSQRPKMVGELLEEACEEGMVVVGLEQPIGVEEHTQLRTFTMGPDERQCAVRVSLELAEILRPHDQVAILQCSDDGAAHSERADGFVSAARRMGAELVGEGPQVVSVSDVGATTKAILTTNPNLKAIMATSDRVALATIEELRNQGLSQNVKVVAIDNDEQSRPFLKSGELLATVEQNRTMIPNYGIQLALQVLESDRTGSFPGIAETPMDIVTANSILND